MPKWNTWEGAFRAAGEGHLGLHYGSNVYTLEAANDRRKALGGFVFRSWIECFRDGSWKRISQVELTPTEKETVSKQLV
jgi:hypothetical protein